MVIQILLRLVQKPLMLLQRTISLTIANWPITTIALVLGVSAEEIYYGFRILKWLAII